MELGDIQIIVCFELNTMGCKPNSPKKLKSVLIVVLNKNQTHNYKKT